MTKKELKEHVRAIQHAIEVLLPEDEPDCTRSWVYETAVKVVADRLARQVLEGTSLDGYDTSRNLMRAAERRYGLDSTEALEMSYDNQRLDARLVARRLKGLLSPVARKLSSQPLPAAPTSQEPAP